MRLAGVPVSPEWAAQLARMVKGAGAVELADRLDRANHDEVALLALTIDERAIILAALEDPPDWFVEQCAVSDVSVDRARRDPQNRAGLVTVSSPLGRAPFVRAIAHKSINPIGKIDNASALVPGDAPVD